MTARQQQHTDPVAYWRRVIDGLEGRAKGAAAAHAGLLERRRAMALQLQTDAAAATRRHAEALDMEIQSSERQSREIADALEQARAKLAEAERKAADTAEAARKAATLALVDELAAAAGAVDEAIADLSAAMQRHAELARQLRAGTPDDMKPEPRLVLLGALSALWRGLGAIRGFGVDDHLPMENRSYGSDSVARVTERCTARVRAWAAGGEKREAA